MRLWRRSRGDNFLDREWMVATARSDLELGEHILDQALEVGFVGTATTDGHQVLPVFTSEKRLVESMPQGSHWIGLMGRDLLMLFLQGEWEAIVVDPTVEDGIEIRRPQAEEMLSVR